MNKIRFIFLLLVLCYVSICDAEKIKLYTFYTPSHEELFFEWFLPSIQDDFELVVERYKQEECPSGVYRSEGWIKIMLRKVDLIIRAINENWGKVFIHADVDIQFFRSFGNKVSSLIRDYDMVFQRDDPAGQVCAGFFISRGNERTLTLWKTIREKMIKDPSKHDQEFLNDIIRDPNYNDVIWNYLPETFLSGGTLTGKRWEPGDVLKIPENIILHHANWTRGIKNKVAQLKYVRSSIKDMSL